MTMVLERRYAQTLAPFIERRAAGPSSRAGTYLSGYAVTYNTRFDMGGGIQETILPGAFTELLKTKPDVRALFNHDENMLIGRTSSGTLKLREDGNGLFMEVALPDTQLGRDLAELVRRRDLSGQSFSFYQPVDSWRKLDNGTMLREIKQFKNLVDVGPVVFPAYKSTTVSTSGGELKSVGVMAQRELDPGTEWRRLQIDDLV